MNGLTDPKSTTTTLVVAVSTSSEIAPTTASKSDNNPAMPSRVPLLTAINCGRMNHINGQSDTSKHKKDQKSILETTSHSQMQPCGLYLFAQNRHSHKHMKTGADKSMGPRVNCQTSVAKDHKLHYQEEFNKMRERLFRLLSKVPIQVESVNSDYEPSSSSTSATPSSSSSSLSQSQGFRKINRKPLIIKYYNERSLTDILDQHFGCSLIKHNFEHGVPLDAHLLKITTTASFNDANSTAPNQCSCFNPNHRPHHPMDTPPTDNDGRASIYPEEVSHRPSIQTTQYESSAQAIYNETGPHSQVADYRGFQTSSWEMQLPAVYCAETIRDTSSGNKSSVHDHQSRSSSRAHKEAKYNGRLCATGSNQRSSGGTAGFRRQKRSSSSTSIMASRSSCMTGRSAGKQQVGASHGTDTTEPSLASNDPSADRAHSPMYLSASDIKRMADKTTSYLESGQTVENFALSVADSFASGSQLDVASDVGGAVSLNTTTDGASFAPHLFDNYQQYHQNHNHHQTHHQHPQQQQQQQHHQTDLSNLYSSPTGSSSYRPADPAPGSQLVVSPAESAQQIISFSQHQASDPQNRLSVSIEPSFNQRHQPQNRQVDSSFNSMSDSSSRARHLVDSEPLGAYYPANGYQQPVEVVQPENAWQQLCQPMLASPNNGPHLGPDEQAHLQQQMIDQQQHRLQNNNGFLTSESYTEHDIGFYLAPNANYVVYADCQQTALNGSSMENMIPTPHYHDMSQINTDQHNHHHHLNHHSISRID